MRHAAWAVGRLERHSSWAGHGAGKRLGVVLKRHLGSDLVFLLVFALNKNVVMVVAGKSHLTTTNANIAVGARKGNDGLSIPALGQLHRSCWTAKGAHIRPVTMHV